MMSKQNLALVAAVCGVAFQGCKEDKNTKEEPGVCFEQEFWVDSEETQACRSCLLDVRTFLNRFLMQSIIISNFRTFVSNLFNNNIVFRNDNMLTILFCTVRTRVSMISLSCSMTVHCRHLRYRSCSRHLKNVEPRFRTRAKVRIFGGNRHPDVKYTLCKHQNHHTEHHNFVHHESLYDFITCFVLLQWCLYVAVDPNYQTFETPEDMIPLLDAADECGGDTSELRIELGLEEEPSGQAVSQAVARNSGKILRGVRSLNWLWARAASDDIYM